MKCLENAKFASTTADCWTSHRKSYIGMTVTWLEDDLVRRSTCLGILPIKGLHTYDVLAKAIDNIHTEFGIGSKVNSVTTDDGSNFLKVSNTFGKEVDVVTETVANPTEDINEQEREDEEEGFVYFYLGNILQSAPTANISNDHFNSESSDDEQEIRLPRKLRCPCDTLSLIAESDVDKITNVSF